MPKNCKSSDIKDLRSGQKGAYKPAYKKSEKNGGDQLRDMPAEVAEIVAVWHDLPLSLFGMIYHNTSRPQSKRWFKQLCKEISNDRIKKAIGS
jgi:hypothetical protein